MTLSQDIFLLPRGIQSPGGELAVLRVPPQPTCTDPVSFLLSFVGHCLLGQEEGLRSSYCHGIMTCGSECSGLGALTLVLHHRCPVTSGMMSFAVDGADKYFPAFLRASGIPFPSPRLSTHLLLGLWGWLSGWVTPGSGWLRESCRLSLLSAWA